MTVEASLRPLDPQWAPFFAWTRNTSAAKVMAALEAKSPGGARYVGGCVRDSLLGAAPKDVDIATVLTPDETSAALHAAGLGAAPTGVEHGTVTAIADHVGVEVTTLRADVSTDGRRATVLFATDWALDARRRDFRLNAIYLTSDGRLYDPVGGVEDACAGRVRFIGEAQARIREDYLRILRFFRFSARFGAAFDADGLAATARLKDGLEKLSAERIGDELLKIFSLANAPAAVDAMAATGVLQKVWPETPDRSALRRLKEANPASDAVIALAALWPGAGPELDTRLRLSNADAARRRKADAVATELGSTLSRKQAREVIHRAGQDRFRDGLAVAAARAGAGDWSSLRALLENDPPPEFPISGKDVVAAGIAPGPDVAAILKAVENAWIAEDFPPAARLRALLESAVVAHKR